jgi:long-chain acyl-CoA synthetase
MTHTGPMTDHAAKPWEKAYPATCRWDVPIVTQPIPEMMDAAIARYAENTALVYRGNALTYREIGAESMQLAAGFLAAGVKPGDAVGVYMPNTASYFIVFYALMRIGVRLVSLSPLDASRELRFKLADTGARLIITVDQETMMRNCLSIADEQQIDRIWVASEKRWGAQSPEAAPLPDDSRFRSIDTLMGATKPDKWPKLTSEDIAVLQYTGGTTGSPKAAMLTHGNLTAAVDMSVRWKDVEAQTPGKERVLGVLPLFHSYAMLFLLLRQFREGCCVFLHQRFDVDAVVRQIETEKLTVFPGVPTMWIAIAGHPGTEERDFSSLRFCISGGAPLPGEIANRIERMVGRKLLGGWGLTEAAPVGTQIPQAADMKPGIIGVPHPGSELEVVSLEDASRILGDNEIGELRIKGPNVCRGYWNRPEENAASFIDGFFLTGDIGYRDEKGLYYLVDRKKSLIISSGFNIYPNKVENAIYEHPDVSEVLVIGVPDDYRGQTVKAFICMKPGAEALDLETLRTFLAERVSRYELPTALELRTELPRSAAGKLLRRVLEDEEKAGASVTLTGA